MSSPSKKKSKRVDLTLAQKQQLCSLQADNPSLKKAEIFRLAVSQGLPVKQSACYGILNNSERYQQQDDGAAVGASTSSGRRDRGGAHKHLDSALLTWLNQRVADGIPISDDLLIGQARLMGARLGVPDSFQYSAGWLYRWKLRYRIRRYTQHGEAASVNAADAARGRLAAVEQLAEFKPEDVFNMDESALFYRLAPNTTLASRAQPGQKRSKERVTVALCVNATGSEPLTPIVIGKAKNPRCFRGFNAQAFVDYYNSKNAWMTSKIFCEWLDKLNQSMASQKRKIALVMDYHSSHGDIDCSNIKLVFLPPNMTSCLQPLDQGIIRSFKCYYRKLLVTHWLGCLEENGELGQVDMRFVCRSVKLAWQLVQPETVVACWRHSGILAQENGADAAEEAGEMAELEELVVQLPEMAAGQRAAIEWVSADDHESTGERLTDDEIVESVLKTAEVVELDQTDPDQEQSVNTAPVQPPVSVVVASSALNTLLEFTQQNMNCFSAEDVGSVQNLQSKLLSLRQKHLVQAPITNYFRSTSSMSD